MAKTNMDVDFLDNDEAGNIQATPDNKADHDKHKRAEVAHKLAVVLMFDRKAHNIREERKNASTDTQKPLRRKGALNGNA